MLFWYGKNRVNWSPDGRFIAMDIFPALKTGIKEYRDMKLVIDMRENRFTVFLIAGSAGHAVDFRKRGVVKIIPGKPEKKATAYTMVKNVSARLRDLLWADLHNIGETVEMIERGHWGHVMGYNNNNVNIYFKNSYVPWFYPDQTDKK
ncbi:MAG: hypothetical protein LLG37_06535 [Spirochaetia bacterium]|nr:hypothetical protein [Spirochaetia bacterium]